MLLRFIFLIGILLTLIQPVAGQYNYNRIRIFKPKVICKKLEKKKKAKKKWRLFGKKPDPEQVNRVSTNYNYLSNATYPTTDPPPEKKRETLPEPENLVASTESRPEPDFEAIPPDQLPDPVNEKQAEIRKKVYEKIKKGEDFEPILKSLFFITADVEFTYVDFEPFLEAVEYALQGRMILIEGHTDNRGDDEYNLNLSMRRVRQIERLMLDIGVPQERISVIGYGEKMPKYDNSTEEGRLKNRRVDFKIF